MANGSRRKEGRGVSLDEASLSDMLTANMSWIAILLLLGSSAAMLTGHPYLSFAMEGLLAASVLAGFAISYRKSPDTTLRGLGLAALVVGFGSLVGLIVLHFMR